MEEPGKYSIPKPVKPSYISEEDIQKLKDDNLKAMGLVPMKLEREILLRRISEGGWSGEFLADAFISAYTGTPFNWRLDKLISLDGEGFRLFHQILHIRHVENWNDDDYAQILRDVKSALKNRRELEQ
jgi:hypothetical protein